MDEVEESEDEITDYDELIVSCITKKPNFLPFKIGQLNKKEIFYALMLYLKPKIQEFIKRMSFFNEQER